MASDPDRGLFPETTDVGKEVDKNVIACFPEGSKITDIQRYRASYWARTVRIDTEQEGGSPKSYFLKVSDGVNGKSTMLGEYESMKIIERYAPELVPHPIATGSFDADPSIHFFLSDLREMDQEVPDMEKLCFKLAAMHKNSQASGIKQFGFHVTTHNGSLPQENAWSDSWEKFYARGMKHMLDLEEKAQGPQSEEMKAIIQPLFEKVIPRLLRPMETEGRHIPPSIVHGDLWHGNTSNDIHTSEPLIFDASAFWGHNEYDLRTMARRTRYKFCPIWQKEYLKHYPASPPLEDFDARSALYILRSELHDSALFPANPKFRQLFIQAAKHLVDAYHDGYEGYVASRALNHAGKDEADNLERRQEIIDSRGESKKAAVIST